MNCGVDCDREVISMWPLGVIAGVISAGALAGVFLGRDRMPPMERRLRALALLRDLAEQPRAAIPDLVPPPETPTDHVRILEEGAEGDRPPARPPATRRTRARRAGEPHSSASSPEIERPTIEIRTSAARDPGVFIAEAAPDTGGRAMTAPSSHHSSRVSSRFSAVAIAAAFVVAVTGVVAAVALNGHTPARAKASNAAPGRAEKPRSLVATTTARPSTTTSTAPVAPVVARSTNGATVSVRSPFRLTLHATGTCWVEITDAAGHTLFTTTLHSGDQQEIPGVGPIVVRLGYTPAMTISVDGTGLDLSGLGQTTNLTFQSA
jgi:cytoskeletal protein RodZ